MTSHNTTVHHITLPHFPSIFFPDENATAYPIALPHHIAPYQTTSSHYQITPSQTINHMKSHQTHHIASHDITPHGKLEHMTSHYMKSHHIRAHHASHYIGPPHTTHHTMAHITLGHATTYITPYQTRFSHHNTDSFRYRDRQETGRRCRSHQ
jgi:hypothetical protein